jgi:hypothetical protein
MNNTNPNSFNLKNKNKGDPEKPIWNTLKKNWAYLLLFPALCCFLLLPFGIKNDATMIVFSLSLFFGTWIIFRVKNPKTKTKEKKVAQDFPEEDSNQLIEEIKHPGYSKKQARILSILLTTILFCSMMFVSKQIFNVELIDLFKEVNPHVFLGVAIFSAFSLKKYHKQITNNN